jgi:transposase
MLVPDLRPVLEAIYTFKQRLSSLRLEKHRTHNRCQQLAHRFLRQVAELRCCGLASPVQLGNTLYTWKEEIACMVALYS